MRIGELAQRAGVGIDTVRYYEREGLLRPPPRAASGYRSYAAVDVQRLRFVRRAKQLGFTLPQVRELLALSGNTGLDMAVLKVTASQKLAEIDERMADLARVRAGLAALVEACPGHGQLQSCPILNALSEEPA
jgi:MerR family copper efflux transcriptional regulator